MKINEQPQGKRLGKLQYGGKACDIRTLPKCQATAKSTGKRCGNIAMKGKSVCYLHGGKSPGAKMGNQNAYKHGNYTAEAIAGRQYIQQLIKYSQELLGQL